MSSSSDRSAAPRPGHNLHDQEAKETPRSAAGSRRSSKYEIYGTATRPFGESYRRSLQLQPEDLEPAAAPQARAPTPDMGCSTSRTPITEEAAPGTFQQTAHRDDQRPANTDVKVNGVIMKTINNNNNNSNNHNNNINNYKGMSDFEIIYGTEDSNKNNIDEGYSTTDIYSEVKKPEKTEKKSKQTQQNEQTPREKLMQQIRDRKEETEDDKTNGYCSFSTVEKPTQCETESTNEIEKPQNSVKTNQKEEVETTVASEPVSFVEEEYSYEPGKQETTSKLVVRSRSLINLDQHQGNCANACTLTRPNKLKITTKPDGSIRYGLRQGSELDLVDDSPPPRSDTRTNYVSSLRSAFDAAVESHRRDQGRAEAFDGLRQYLQDHKHGLRELLVNNNVVIIEPLRPQAPVSPQASDTSSQRTCRITGATVKSPTTEQRPFVPSNTLPRRNNKGRPAKQGFYHPIKVNKELIDAELPDPDKVKHAKAMFEKIFTSRSADASATAQTPRPYYNSLPSKARITAEVKVVGGQEELKRLQRRWTDSGSLSSGVSSDLSCDHDDYCHHDRISEEYSSDDEVEYVYPYDDAETHPVSSEVLQQIRACGTSVTYYGGRIISRSHGPLRSPMTMAIMDEIRRHGGTHQGRKVFEEEPTPALGVKFRLVKSHSCGSRLEIAGTEDSAPRVTTTSPRHESLRGESIAEEAAEPPVPPRDTHSSLEEEEDKAEADRYVPPETNPSAPPPTTTMTWAELKLKEARRLWHLAPEAVRAPPQDMEFETFEVLEDPQPHKQDNTETGRG